MNVTSKGPSQNTCSFNHSRNGKDFPRICPSKLSRRELEDLYFNVLDNNIELKKTVNSQRDKIKLLSTKVNRMTASQRHSLLKEKSDCCSSTKVTLEERNSSIADLKRENEQLSEKIRVLNVTLCSAKQFLGKNTNQSLPRCPRCNICVKNSSTTVINKSSDSTKFTSVSCQCLILNNTESVMTETEGEGLQKDSPKKSCDENKCRTEVEKLKQRIVELEKELSTAHTMYSSKISRLEDQHRHLESEYKMARAEKAASEHSAKTMDEENKQLVNRMRDYERREEETSIELTTRKNKIKELLTQLKAAQMSDEIAKTIEKHFNHLHSKKKKETSDQSIMAALDSPTTTKRAFLENTSSPYSDSLKRSDTKTQLFTDQDNARNTDDSGYTDVNRTGDDDDGEKVSKEVFQDLVRRVAALQSQWDQMKAKASDTASSKNRSRCEEKRDSESSLKELKRTDSRLNLICDPECTEPANCFIDPNTLNGDSKRKTDELQPNDIGKNTMNDFEASKDEHNMYISNGKISPENKKELTHDAKKVDTNKTSDQSKVPKQTNNGFQQIIGPETAAGTSKYLLYNNTDETKHSIKETKSKTKNDENITSSKPATLKNEELTRESKSQKKIQIPKSNVQIKDKVTSRINKIDGNTAENNTTKKGNKIQTRVRKIKEDLINSSNKFKGNDKQVIEQTADKKSLITEYPSSVYERANDIILRRHIGAVKEDENEKVHSPSSSSCARTYLVSAATSCRCESDNTDYEISSISDSPRDGRTAPTRSSGEERFTSTHNESYKFPMNNRQSLSEGEVPYYKGPLSEGEKPQPRRKDDTTNTENAVPQDTLTKRMEAALCSINEELTRCKQLLLTKPYQYLTGAVREPPPCPPLKRCNARESINGAVPQKCTFVIHFGTLVLCDEAVKLSREMSLVMSWQLFDQGPNSTHVKRARITYFDFSVEYTLDMSEGFVDYLRQEEMPLILRGFNKQENPFAYCALPLKETLLRLNKRVYMSLPLLYCSRHTSIDESLSGLEIGILDVWCQLTVPDAFRDELEKHSSFNGSQGSKKTVAQQNSTAGSRNKSIVNTLMLPRQNSARFQTQIDCKYSQTFAITIQWLALTDQCLCKLNPALKRLYVSYEFLGRSDEDMETPYSFPRPETCMDKCRFNYKKSFHIAETDYHRFGRLAKCKSPDRGRHNRKDCISFAVISEPVHSDFGAVDCEDLGYAYLYLGDVVSYSEEDSHSEVLALENNDGQWCGILSVRLDGLTLLRRCALLDTDDIVQCDV